MRIDFRTASYIPGLDGWRAISVLIVMLAHFGFKDIIPGGLGVTIFFFISGFLITTLLVKERNDRGAVSIKDFYIRRFLRLMPELFFMLVLTGIYRYAFNEFPSTAEIVAVLTYTTNYFVFWVDNFSNSNFHLSWSVLWSLAVEEHYYILYPLIFSAWLLNGKRQLTFILSILLFGLIYRIILVYTGAAHIDSAHPYTYVASEARFDSIAYGAALAFAMQRPLQITNKAAFATAIAGGGLILLSLLLRNPEFRETARYSVQGIGLFLIFAALYNATVWDWAIRILELAPIKRLGVLSYACYLWHMEYMYLMERLAGFGRDDVTGIRQIAFVLGGVVFAVVIAEISYRLVARPFQRLRGRFGSHKTA